MKIRTSNFLIIIGFTLSALFAAFTSIMTVAMFPLINSSEDKFIFIGYAVLASISVFLMSIVMKKSNYLEKWLK